MDLGLTFLTVFCGIILLLDLYAFRFKRMVDDHFTKPLERDSSNIDITNSELSDDKSIKGLDLSSIFKIGMDDYKPEKFKLFEFYVDVYRNENEFDTIYERVLGLDIDQAMDSIYEKFDYNCTIWHAGQVEENTIDICLN